ncbi:MAG: Sua5/YciO/YrdC/YwlC family protein, partial [Planctomycetales bacterium]|nr:Sua5/YciO/YrdC/YwlC family protein [Planctomycetales bacterium]
MSDPSDAHILAAARLLRDGGLVAFPTETVYGLGANALDPLAVAGIFELKGRPRFDPLIVHLDTADLLPTVADLTAIPTAIGGELIEQLVERFWPGPLTLVLPKADAVPGIV